MPAALLALIGVWTAAVAQDGLGLAQLSREGFVARMADQGEREDHDRDDRRDRDAGDPPDEGRTLVEASGQPPQHQHSPFMARFVHPFAICGNGK